MDTIKKAGFNMMKFVGGIFGIALVLAGLYFFVLTTGTPEKETVPPPQSGTTEQHSR